MAMLAVREFLDAVGTGKLFSRSLSLSLPLISPVDLDIRDANRYIARYDCTFSFILLFLSEFSCFEWRKTLDFSLKSF